MNSVVINKHPLHLEVSLLARSLVCILNEGVLKTVTSPFVTDDFAGEDSAKAGEDQLKVLVYVVVSVVGLEAGTAVSYLSLLG